MWRGGQISRVCDLHEQSKVARAYEEIRLSEEVPSNTTLCQLASANLTRSRHWYSYFHIQISSVRYYTKPQLRSKHTADHCPPVDLLTANGVIPNVNRYDWRGGTWSSLPPSRTAFKTATLEPFIYRNNSGAAKTEETASSPTKMKMPPKSPR